MQQIIFNQQYSTQYISDKFSDKQGLRLTPP